MRAGFRLHPSVMCRVVDDKLVLIHLDQNDLFYFSPESKPFFDLFKFGRTVDQVVDRLGSDADADTTGSVERMVTFLREMNLLEDTFAVDSSIDEESDDVPVIPRFLSKENAEWDRVAYLYP